MNDTEDFSIIEKENKWKRFGLVFDVDGRKKHLLSNTSPWEETNSESIWPRDFIEDGKLHVTKIAREVDSKGKLGTVVYPVYPKIPWILTFPSLQTKHGICPKFYTAGFSG